MNITTSCCALVRFGTDEFYSTNSIELNDNFYNSKLNTHHFSEMMQSEAIMITLITSESCEASALIDSTRYRSVPMLKLLKLLTITYSLAMSMPLCATIFRASHRPEKELDDELRKKDTEIPLSVHWGIFI
jgi:hypothetical protein